MSDEQPTEQTPAPSNDSLPTQTPATPPEQPTNTLESITQEIVELKKSFNDSLKQKDDEITNLKNQLKEQDNLIGNYKEKLFSSNTEPEQMTDPAEEIVSKAYEGAYTALYNSLKHRLNRSVNKAKFLKKCEEAHNER